MLTYRIEAGTAPGLSNIGIFDVGVVTGLTVAAPPGTYYARVRGVGSDGVGAPSNELTVVVVGSGPPPPTPPLPPTPPPAPGPTSTFGPGQHLVGRTIQPGRYYSVPVSGCYWERQRGLTGSLNDVIANEFVGFNAGQWIVDIAPSDVAFETDAQCGTWFSTPRRGLQSTIAPGVWLVGSQVSPGTYSAFVQRGCYWERRRDFSGLLSGIIDNEFVDFASTQYVAVAPSDVGFLNDGDCGFWSRAGISAPVRGSTMQSIERARQLRWERMRREQQ